MKIRLVHFKGFLPIRICRFKINFILNFTVGKVFDGTIASSIIGLGKVAEWSSNVFRNAESDELNSLLTVWQTIWSCLIWKVNFTQKSFSKLFNSMNCLCFDYATFCGLGTVNMEVENWIQMLNKRKFSFNKTWRKICPRTIKQVDDIFVETSMQSSCSGIFNDFLSAAKAL